MANIDLEKLNQLVADSDKIFLSPVAEQTLLQLLEIQKQVEMAIDEAKKRIEETALKIDPNFKSIQSDKVKISYRYFGTRFYVDQQSLEYTPKELYTAEVKTTYKVDAKAVEKWIDEKGKLPAGIVEADRTKTLTIVPKEGGKHEQV